MYIEKVRDTWKHIELIVEVLEKSPLVRCTEPDGHVYHLLAGEYRLRLENKRFILCEEGSEKEYRNAR